MKKRNIIILCIIGFIAIILSINLYSVHYFHFLDNNGEINILYQPHISLLKSSDNNYFISTTFEVNSDYQIEEFKFDYGFINIGNYKILFDKNEININIKINDWRDYRNEVYLIINGNEYISKLDDSIHMENENILYFFNFSKNNIRNVEIKNIIDGYKKNNNSVNLYLKYEIRINDELITKEINNNYILEIKTNKFNIIKIIIAYLLVFAGGH